MKANQEVNSVQEAINLGYLYVIAYRNHYSGNSKGEIYRCVAEHANVELSHFNYEDRGIERMVATDDDVLAIQCLRKKIIGLIQTVEWSMSVHSPLFGGVKSVYVKHKMVFGNYRAIYKRVQCTGAINYNNSTFMNRHKNILTFLKEKLTTMPYVSTTMPIL